MDRDMKGLSALIGMAANSGIPTPDRTHATGGFKRGRPFCIHSSATQCHYCRARIQFLAMVFLLAVLGGSQARPASILERWSTIRVKRC